MPLQPQRINIPVSGGLVQDETPEYLDPPALFQCDNFYHATKSSLLKRNGYDAHNVIVDPSFGTQPISDPLAATPIDRFLQNGASVTFAARGYLWSYDPLLYAGATGISPVPNTIRHGEVPDAQIIQQQAISLDRTHTIHCIKDAAACAGVAGTQCIGYLVQNDSTYTWRLRILSDDKVVSDTKVNDFSHVLVRPCVARYSSGFIATVLDMDAQIIYAQRFSFTSMQWTSLTWPTITATGGTSGASIIPGWYDLCGTNSNRLIVAHVAKDALITGGGTDVTHEPGSLWAYVLNASTGLVESGPYHIGKTSWVGGLPGATVAIAGDASGKIGVIWFDSATNLTHLRTVVSGTMSALVTLSSENTDRVGIGFIAPTNARDAVWNAVWEYTSLSLSYSGVLRHVVQSEIYSSSLSLVGSPRTYFSSVIVTDPWCMNGGMYTVLAPDTLNEPLGGGHHYGDVPFILTRTWNDQWYGDNNELTNNYQFPHAVWGYGEAMLTTMPSRVQVDTSGLKGLGAIVKQDVALPGVGVSVSLTTFDPTSADRYDSAELPEGGVMFGCAQPWTFDGQRSFESAFCQRPVLISASQTADDGTLHLDSTSDDYHFIQIIFEHVDECGRVYSSPVSATNKIQISNEGSSLTLVVSNLFWTARKANSVTLKVFMCRDNETFSLVGAVTCPTYKFNDTPEDVSVTITQEADQISPPPPTIYTYDGTLEAGFPQLAPQLTRWNNRIWLGDGQNLSYSQFFLPDIAPSFPDTFTEAIDRNITALLSLDDRLIVFSSDAVMYRSGEGPNLNGQGSSYSSLAFITHQVGCMNPRSVVYALPGIFFQSRRGIELMDLQGSVVHQRAIESYFTPGSEQGFGDTVVGSLSLPRDHQARLLYRAIADDTLHQLVYDYSTGTWSRWFSQAPWIGDSYVYCGDIGVVGDDVYIADAEGTIFIERPGRHYDEIVPDTGAPAHQHIDWAVTSPWIKIDGLLGVQRVWRSMVSFKAQSWGSPSPGDPVPTLGMGIVESSDYGDNSVAHASKTIADLQVVRNSSSGICSLQIGHKYQQCSAYQLKLSSADNNAWGPAKDVSGVTEILGLWSELGVEPGTGRGRKEGKI